MIRSRNEPLQIFVHQAGLKIEPQLFDMIKPWILLFVALASSFSITRSAWAASRPNFLLIMVDDLNGEVGCYGRKSAITPRIDSFAVTAVRFSHAYCQAPLCNPARTSMLTGLRPACGRKLPV